MKFVCLSDTHGNHRLIKNLTSADCIIHAGDVSKDGSERSCIDFLTWFNKLDYQYKVFIAGNHDFYFEEESPKYLEKILPSNVIYLNDSGVTIKGVNIWGSPVTPRFYDWAFNRDRGSTINNHWKLIPADTDLLVTHGPPQGILDNVAGFPVGCADLLKKVKKIKPKLHVFGHIHGGYGRELRDQTCFVNASILNDNYEVVNAAQCISLENIEGVKII